MKNVQKNILIIAGIISLLIGITVAIPSFFKERLVLAVLSVMLMIFGFILLAIGFGD